jgi:hypothetical protein
MIWELFLIGKVSCYPVSRFRLKNQSPLLHDHRPADRSYGVCDQPIARNPATAAATSVNLRRINAMT